MTEYWIWSNRMHGWRAQSPKTYTGELRLAGRFAEHLAMQYVKIANEVIGDTDYPIEVMLEVNNTFLSREAQRILAEYEKTGDRAVIDHAYFNAEARAIVASRVIHPSELGEVDMSGPRQDFEWDRRQDELQEKSMEATDG